jgi:hypothetical protein
MELSYDNYQIERSLKKAKSRVDCPVLDIWKDDDSESISYFIAWELMVTDQHGQPLSPSAGAENLTIIDCTVVSRCVR